LQSNPKFSAVLDDETVDLFFKSAPLHDIGKVGIPDAILLKAGKLSDDEFAIMKTHPMLGADAITVAERWLGSNSFLKTAREIAVSHHEKWDGSGYPHGLRGEEIPLAGRIMAVVDVYDALVSKRVYKPAVTHGKAVELIISDAGSHFDPDVIAAFESTLDEFVAIREQFQDSSEGEAVDFDPRTDPQSP